VCYRSKVCLRLMFQSNPNRGRQTSSIDRSHEI
jgi:hypothetical protein